MKNYISKKILRYYSRLLEEHGYDPQSVGWGNLKGKQSLRFDILCQIGNLSNSTILDVGCGFGDLYRYLQYKKIIVKYLGVDINDELLKIGRKINPKIKLELRDIEKKKFTRKFDWVIASGITSHGSTYSHIKSVLSEMFRICKKGVAMNFVSDFVDYKTKGLFYSSPEKIYSIMRTLSNRVVLRHDYMPYEFTIYVYKDNKKTSNNIFKGYFTGSDNLSDRSWHPKYRN